MQKRAIGILDMGFEGLCLLKNIAKYFKNEDFIYINDIENSPYEGNEQNVIVKYVKSKVEYLLKKDIKLLVVVSDSVVEYASDYLESLDIPVINIVDSIIDYVNEKYDQKNLALCAKSYIIKANLYQKNFKYNHLYNVISDEMESVLANGKTKTSASFKVVEKAFALLSKKEVDLLIFSSPWLELLYTEIYEYADLKEMIKLSDILISKIKDSGVELYSRARGKSYIVSSLDKKTLNYKIKSFDIKYKYISLFGDKENNE